ncbi:YibE/F family protein [Amycolatopsis thermalba]|uniref:YibE/F family protein n=1 Tax=Amycolatopsis thermalba TaxID=944492 RepID=A0ABY4NWM6_9PSEU|nr:YibE/F family protein [Amycolatopsis thermalba]UQS24451.1 YibE/F family protein [Amycolatopsis thermalba]
MQHDDDPTAETGPIRRIPGPPAADPRRARRARRYAETGDSPARPAGGDALGGRPAAGASSAEHRADGRHGTGSGSSARAGGGAPGTGRRSRATAAEADSRRTGRRNPDERTARPPRSPAGSDEAAGPSEASLPRAAHRASGAGRPRRGRAESTGHRARRSEDTPPRAAAPPTGHGHGHGHSPAPPASRRVKLLLIWLLAPIALATVAGLLLLYPWGQAEPDSAISQGTPVHGTISTATSGPCLAAGQVQVGDQPDAKPCLTATITLTDGPGSGRTVELTVPIEPSTPRFSAGDDVVLAYNGGDAADPGSYQLVDFQRGLPLAVLAALFAIAVVVLGRWHGLAALGALVLSFVVLVAFVLPAILAGENPLLVAIVGAGLIMFIALYLTHGLSARTSVAVLGTLVSLALIGALSATFSAAASLTGLDDSTSTLIASLGHGIDARGLLLAGIVIGALGVLDDVTVTQTSAVWELRRANPSLTWRELYSAGLRIGRDHVGSAVNTLVMAYAGAALPVMLYSSISGVGLGAILGSQDVAQEIVRTLAGSVGIVAAVPVTTVLAAMIASREPVSPTRHSSDH